MEQHVVWPIFFALQESPLGHAMRLSPMLYPAVEILHILGFVVLVGSIIALDLRLLGIGRSMAIPSLAGLLLLPLAVPLLIFGAANALPLEAAVSLLLVAGAPFVAGAAIRASRT